MRAGGLKVLGLFCTLYAGPAMASAEPDPRDTPLLHAPWQQLAGTGFAIGYKNGSWGGQWTQALHLEVPLLRMRAGAGFGLRGTFIAIHPTVKDASRADLGGRLELTGRSPVFLNLVRLYGGGGVQLLKPVDDAPDMSASIGGGGYFGIEAFLTRWMSFAFEIGGNSGSTDSFGSGATITGGVHFYPAG